MCVVTAPCTTTCASPASWNVWERWAWSTTRHPSFASCFTRPSSLATSAAHWTAATTTGSAPSRTTRNGRISRIMQSCCFDRCRRVMRMAQEMTNSGQNGRAVEDSVNSNMGDCRRLVVPCTMTWRNCESAVLSRTMVMAWREVI